ncbi:MAG: hypothetical protein AAF610_00105 [Pseudomonadota bacterium]
MEVLLKSDRTGAHAARTGVVSGGDRGRWLAAVLLGFLYLVMLAVFSESFEARAEFVDAAGRTLLEDRPVFWPLILFALVGRLLCAIVAWYPSWSDPTYGLLAVPDSPPLRRRRRVFRVLYASGLAMALVTLINNLAIQDVMGVLSAIGFAFLFLVGISLVFRFALASFLSRLSVRARRR